MCMAVYVYACVSQEKALLIYCYTWVEVYEYYIHTHILTYTADQNNIHTHMHMSTCIYVCIVYMLGHSCTAAEQRAQHISKAKNHFLHWNSALKSNEGMKRAKKKTKINPTDREILEF